MKKYLFTAALAVAVSGAFVSCHEDEISGSLIEQKAKAFEEIFVEAFGQPVPYHTWGFKQGISANARGITRTEVDPKGNMWPEKPTVGTTEEADVLLYVNRETSTDWTWYYPMPENLNNYFVTQIHKGTNTYYGYGQTENDAFTGSNQMDQLIIADESDASITDGVKNGSWFHVYDFNSGNSIDYGGNMLVIKSNTFDFAYHGSHDSQYHARWIAIDGKDVTRTDGKGADYSNYYYICFDYESTPYDCYTNFRWFTKKVFDNEPNRVEYQEHTGKLSGPWTVESADGKSIQCTKDNCCGGKTYVIDKNSVREDNQQAAWQAETPFNGDKWIPGDNKYTDWIIRLVKADVDIPDDPDDPDDPTPPSEGDQWKIVEGEKVIEAGRVFCEDLGANTRNDVDYNDVVFDAIIVNHYIKLVTTTVVDGVETTTETTSFTKNGISGVDETYAKVCLLAAGGTIPANVCGHEIHNELSNGNLSTVVMINTTTDRESVNGAQIDYSCSPVIIQEAVSGQENATQDKKFYYNSQNQPITCINDIDIVVLYGNAVTTLTANPGSEVPAVPYKICVPIGTPWAKERVNIGIAYTSFAEYCGINPNKQFWNDIGKDGPVWENCGSLFTIKENGVERFIVEGDLLGDGETILAQSTGSSGGGSGAKPGQFWPSNNTSGNATQYFEIGSGTTNVVFSSAKASQKLCIYCTIGNSSWLKLNKAGWGQWTLTDLNSSWRIVGDNKELEPVNGLSSVYNQTKGCIEVQLSAGLINEIKASGIGFNFGNDNMTITNITIE